MKDYNTLYTFTFNKYLKYLKWKLGKYSKDPNNIEGFIKGGSEMSATYNKLNKKFSSKALKRAHEHANLRKWREFGLEFWLTSEIIFSKFLRKIVMIKHFVNALISGRGIF